jgi:hypothetical protein
VNHPFEAVVEKTCRMQAAGGTRPAATGHHKTKREMVDDPLSWPGWPTQQRIAGSSEALVLRLWVGHGDDG